MKFKACVELETPAGEDVDRCVYVEAADCGAARNKIIAGVALFYDIPEADVHMYNFYDELEDPEAVLRGVIGWTSGIPGYCERGDILDNDPLFLVPEPWFAAGRLRKAAAIVDAVVAADGLPSGFRYVASMLDRDHAIAEASVQLAKDCEVVVIDMLGSGSLVLGAYSAL